MERKIGEIFEYNGEWYQCVEQPDYIGDVCKVCSFSGIGNCELDRCSGTYRSDKKSVIFKKLEKVGEPYKFDGHIFQAYRTFEVPIFTENYATVRELGNNSKISIEIKQNKENMEEKKLNLKPFSLELAKAGKPVCTRDGRKVRVLCYDFKQNEEYPILVAVENKDGKECALLYSNGGISEMYKSSNNELAMLPEKKEGWVNVYKERIYSTKEEAIEATYDGVTYVDTVKISWEE